MNFYPLYEGLNNYFLTKRCNHERLKSISRVHGATKVNFIINGAPLRAREASFFLPCERGLNSHTDVATRPHLSLAF